MGFFSKVFKGVKKVVKGIGKAVKKVGSEIWKGAKKVIKSVGKVLNKLGPIGTIAVAMIAPYAVGWMAAQSGFIGAIGSGLKAVGAAASAPFKMAGKALGKGISTLASKAGEGIAKTGFQSLSDAVVSTGSKIGNMLGYKGGELSTELASVRTEVATKWDAAFDTNFSGANPKSTIGTAPISDGSGVIAKPVPDTVIKDAEPFDLKEMYGETEYNKLSGAKEGDSLLGKVKKGAKAYSSAMGSGQPTQGGTVVQRPDSDADDGLALYQVQQTAPLAPPRADANLGFMAQYEQQLAELQSLLARPKLMGS